MPQSQKSLRLTDSYRRRLVAIGTRASLGARVSWPSIEGLDATDWAERNAKTLSRAQLEAVRLTAGYLAAFVRSEGGKPGRPYVDTGAYVGLSRDGKPLAEALVSPLIAVRVALKEGRDPDAALAIGLAKATRRVAFEAVQTGRDALTDLIQANPATSGFRRSVAGTCAACMALSGTAGPKFEVHPGCECLPMPTVVGAKETIAIPTGAELFSRLSKPEQDAKIGAEAAELVREGNADLKDFVSHSPQEAQQDFLTQRPAEQVA